MEVLNFSAFSCASDLQVGCLVFTFLVKCRSEDEKQFCCFQQVRVFQCEGSS